MQKHKLYTAELVGSSYGYEMVIITKWKDVAENSPEEGYKAYYFTPDYEYLRECIKDEDWCRWFYETYPENTRFRII